MFGFEYGAVAQPTETFREVPSTIPPGLVFYYGLASIPQDSVTPIRFIHIEPERIVIDIAGPSAVADRIFGLL
jgi:hypothetical protein